MKMNKIQVNKEKNHVIVRFNNEIYCNHCINNATNDFKDICSIEKSKDGFFLKPKKEIELETLGYEFYNYVLSLMKN